MSNLYWLTDEQMARLEPYFPKSHGKPRVDARRVLSGIVFINRNGLGWRDASKEYEPHKTLYNRWKRWGKRGVFLHMMEGLAAASATPKTIMIDATYLKAHRTASSLRVKRGRRAGHQPHQRGHEHEASRRHRRQRPPAELLHDRWPGQRLHRRCSAARRPAKGAEALHSSTKIQKHSHQIRQAPLPKPQPHRDHVRPPESLAPRRHPLRSMPNRLFSVIALAATVTFWL